MVELTYGFIGIGNMGYGMAMNVATKMTPKAQLIICDVNAAQMQMFQTEASERGVSTVSTAGTPREVAEKADIIITSLPAATHVHTVFTDPSTGLLSSSAQKPKLFIETSTIEVSASLAVRKTVEAASPEYKFLDAPVSGGIPVAAQGTLTVMAGGNETVFQQARPTLALFGKEENLFHCGDAGAGLATKQINNYVAFVSFIGLCEGMNTGLRYGLNPVTLGNIINVSSGMCWNSLHQNPVKGVIANSSSSRDFEGGFPTELAKGVMDMATQLGREVGAKSVMGPVVTDVFQRAVRSEKCRGKECRSVWRLFAEDDGMELD